MSMLQNLSMSEDTLKNILIMAPLLDEVGQNRVFGLMCGLLAGTGERKKEDQLKLPDKPVC